MLERKNRRPGVCENFNLERFTRELERAKLRETCRVSRGKRGPCRMWRAHCSSSLSPGSACKGQCWNQIFLWGCPELNDDIYIETFGEAFSTTKISYFSTWSGHWKIKIDFPWILKDLWQTVKIRAKWARNSEPGILEYLCSLLNLEKPSWV